MYLSVRSVVAFLIVACSAVSLHADEAALRSTIQEYVDAFNKQDIDVVCACWGEDCTHTDRDTGERTEGRDAIRADIAAVFETRPDTRLSGHVDHVRFIKPDIACVDGETTVTAGEDDPVTTAFSAIFVQSDGKWMITSMEEMPTAQPETPSDALADLEWLIGKWVDDGDAARIETTVRWTANRAFLIRSFVVQSKDEEGDARQGTQVIGWDPRAQEIRSWTFNSDGSFGDATWSKNEDDWLIKSSQTLSDGQAAAGTFVMTRIDDNTISLQLIGHSIEGDPQPASPAVQVVRVQDETGDDAAESN